MHVSPYAMCVEGTGLQLLAGWLGQGDISVHQYSHFICRHNGDMYGHNTSTTIALYSSCLGGGTVEPPVRVADGGLA